MPLGWRPEGICNYVAVHMGEGDGDATGHRGAYNWPLSWE